MKYQLERALLKFVEAVEAMLIRLKLLLLWSKELGLLVKRNLQGYIGSSSKRKRKKRKKDEDEHNKHWGIGGF
jgi:hypothetical protein